MNTNTNMHEDNQIMQNPLHTLMGICPAGDNSNMNGLFARPDNGMFKVTIDGKVACRCDSDGSYKTYDISTGALVNYSSMILEGSENFFFIIPATSVKTGDIIVVGDSPRVVTNVAKNKITTFSYDNGEIVDITPEGYAMLGDIHFFRKVVYMLKDSESGDISKNFMKMMMLSSMFSNGGRAATGMGGGFNCNNMMQMLMMTNLMSGKGGGLFDGLFSNEKSVDKETADTAVISEEAK